MSTGDTGKSSPTKATAAGIYDAVLGGVTNTEADRAAAAQLVELEPQVQEMAWANRGFLQRSAAWLARQGVRRFLDIGAGLPTMRNTHDVVQEIDPSARVVYVDNDPMVVAQGKELVGQAPNVSYLQHDLTGDGLLDDPVVAELLDTEEPVGLLLVGLLYFVPDAADPVGTVQRLVAACPPGSYLALSHIISDAHREELIEAGAEVYRSRSTAQLNVRTKEQVRGFLSGLEIVPPFPGAEPALNYIGLWGAEDAAVADDDASRWFVAAVARRP